ncbi:hypothetical protein U5801_11910 [Lamprobacter modestohalophilus]|uniref:hypothetical protein n=1 Tax=Lamprobacter modestohalophilus TaxID=1064514 RepID=UPI002ADEEB3D|nr:hypothetical protein [Lamprobacter modestohalophilus]MEA1050510.1 hypothetical protein [Lamprobacter modestohalophilus]
MTEDMMTWAELRDAAEQALAPFQPDRITLDRYTQPEEWVYTGETAWIACYPVPSANEETHLYVEHVATGALGSHSSRMTVTGKRWGREVALQATSTLNRLILKMEGSL